MFVDYDMIYAGLLAKREEHGRKQEDTRYKSSHWTGVFSLARSILASPIRQLPLDSEFWSEVAVSQKL